MGVLACVVVFGFVLFCVFAIKALCFGKVWQCVVIFRVHHHFLCLQGEFISGSWAWVLFIYLFKERGRSMK